MPELPGVLRDWTSLGIEMRPRVVSFEKATGMKKSQLETEPL
jgi:hypothetical protein